MVTKVNKFSFLVLCLAVLLTACTPLTPREKAGAGGALMGTAVGAGTGAAIGAAIGGDVAASALLGGAIGLPLGIAAGLAYDDYKREEELKANNKVINQNREQIIANSERIDALRTKTELESHGTHINRENGKYLYVGPSLGVYNRN